MKSVAYGEGSVYVDLEIDDAPDRPARTRAVAAALARRFPGADVVVGAGAVAVYGAEPSYELREAARLAAAEREDRGPPRPLRRIEVIYDGPDLEPTARALGLAPGELRDLHASRDYVAEVLGFLPGFAYMGPLDPRIVVPRRASPRAVVPACSVGIAAAYTGIYPFASPGGWSLIGRAVGVVPFDPSREEPSLLQPGDRVRFVPVDVGSVGVPASQPEPSPGKQALRVALAAPGATIQDEGRAGWLGRGIPPSGPTLPELHAAANAAVGNAAGAAAIEVPLGALEIVVEGEVLVSVDGEAARRLGDGERLRVEPSACAVRYLAVRGGIDVPMVLGARATLLVARIGGLGGRALRAGDRLPVGEAAAVAAIPSAPRAAVHDPEPVARLAIDPGPHVERFPAGALEALVRGSFQVSRLGDRVGVRLEGDRIPRDGADVALPVPMRRGAVQVSTDGGPIVLGPDHPVTGGYPVIAVLRREAQAALARARPGAPVRFALA